MNFDILLLRNDWNENSAKDRNAEENGNLVDVKEDILQYLCNLTCYINISYLIFSCKFSRYF